MKYQGLTRKIIGAAYRVDDKMGSGFLESVYERCMLIELAKARVNAQSQVPISVYYDGEPVGEFTADLLVEDLVVVELKAVRELLPAHEVQLVNYLTASGKDVGLLLNFGPRGVDVKRKVRKLEDETGSEAEPETRRDEWKNPVHPVDPVE